MLIEMCCRTCRWWDEFTGACCSGESENVAEFKQPEDMCKRWEEKNGSDNEN